MRILYVANYQGSDVVRQRRIVRNRALGASTKIEQIAGALAARGHTVTVLSAGTAAERSGRWYAGSGSAVSCGGGRFQVQYLPCLDVPVLNRAVGRLATRMWLESNTGWDVALVYNLAPESMAAAEQAHRSGVPVVFEYEDDATATLEAGAGGNAGGFRSVARARLLGQGAITVNEELRSQLGLDNAIAVQGIVPDAMFEWRTRSYHAGEDFRILYSGGLTGPKGIEVLIQATDLLRLPYRLVVTGAGPLAGQVAAAARGNPRIEFLGEVSRDVLESELGKCHACVNPHRTVAGQVGTLFPFKVAEYIACGALVISSPLGTSPDEMAAGILGYDLDSSQELAAAIAVAAESYDARQVGVAAARRYVQARLSASAVGLDVESVLHRARGTK